MVGLTPKTAFLDFLRSSTMGSGTIPAATIKRETNACRDAIFHRFANKMAIVREGRSAAATATVGSSAGRVTRSSAVPDDDDWVVDMDAAECNVTDIRRLDRYCLEQIFVLEEKTKLLLLVSVADDDTVLNGSGEAVSALQKNGTIKLSGREYYRLQCSVSDAKDNQLVTRGVAGRLYSQSRFEDDVRFGRKGFQISHHGTSLVSHITWKKLMANLTSLLFFGAPLSLSRSFGSIFKDAKNPSTLHQKFMCYYEHFFVGIWQMTTKPGEYTWSGMPRLLKI